LALHPAIPFLTDEIYNVTFKKNILESNIIEIEGRCLNKENDSIVNHVLELLNSVRSLKRNKHREFLVVINEEFLLPIRENKIDLERLITSFSGNNKFRISYESKSENEEFREWKFADSNEFMTIFHKDKVNEKELSEKLNFFTFEWERSKKILMNNDFLHKAPSSLIDKEKEKYAYYLKKKREIEMKIEKKKDNS
jgi:valyl-tRNA synthetase